MQTLNLMIDAGKGSRIERGQLATVITPAPTQTWFPIPHAKLVDGVQQSLVRSGLRIVAEAHGLSHEGSRYFGMFQVANGHTHEDYSLIVGLRNSHDKKFPAGLVVGSGVFVCDNPAFSGEIEIGRKHTRFINRDLPQLIESAVGRLGNMRRSQEQRIEAYKGKTLSDAKVHDILIQSLDARVVPASKIPAVLQEWRNPRHEEFAARKNGWRLFNSYTEVLKGSNIFERPRTTQALHGLMDTACGVLVN